MAAAKKKAVKYPCARCGKLSTADGMVYSSWTHARFCGSDFKACDRRAAKLRRQALKTVLA